jgi:4-aminobutyrate aminotransferase-like enzyme
VAAARERQLLILSAGPNVLRLVPPLVIEDADLDRGLAVLAEVLA